MGINEKNTGWMIPFNVHPEWVAKLTRAWPDWKATSKNEGLGLAVPMRDGKLDNDMHELLLARGRDCKDLCLINVPSIRKLFRGNVNPGNLCENRDLKYQFIMSNIAKQWGNLVNMQLLKVPLDVTLLGVFAALSESPDGQSRISDPIYDIIWQAFAFMVGTLEISKAEYKACVSYLLHETTTFCTGFDSTNMYWRSKSLY